MKKQMLVFFYIVLLFIGANAHLLRADLEVEASGPVVIPDEAIRLRILANSDAEKDQALKRKIRDNVNEEITKWVAELTSIDAARELIRSRLGEIEEIVEGVLKEEGVNQTYSVGFGNVEFPTKLYGNYIYPAGEYEAILITLGEGEGANWWCVLFPPLCFLDFSNGEAIDPVEEETKVEEVASEEKDQKEEVEVKFFLFEFFSSLFS
ncbi:stage II sporulation protein R [Bacillus timonensis]|nr:stage II sporulation protein R [Bacillus timonensis]